MESQSKSVNKSGVWPLAKSLNTFVFHQDGEKKRQIDENEKIYQVNLSPIAADSARSPKGPVFVTDGEKTVQKTKPIKSRKKFLKVPEFFQLRKSAVEIFADRMKRKCSHEARQSVTPEPFLAPVDMTETELINQEWEQWQVLERSWRAKPGRVMKLVNDDFRPTLRPKTAQSRLFTKILQGKPSLPQQEFEGCVVLPPAKMF
jgi:hypothetical protein